MNGFYREAGGGVLLFCVTIYGSVTGNHIIMAFGLGLQFGYLFCQGMVSRK